VILGIHRSGDWRADAIVEAPLDYSGTCIINKRPLRRTTRPYDSSEASTVQGERWVYISSVRTREYTRSTSYPNQYENSDTKEARRLTTLNESATMLSYVDPPLSSSYPSQSQSGIHHAKLEGNTLVVEHEQTTTEGSVPLPRDLAWSELDGVSDDVGDDLSQTKRVTNELIWYVGFHIIRKVEVVLGSTDDEGLEVAKDRLRE
jgi:hypothetical protein